MSQETRRVTRSASRASNAEEPHPEPTLVAQEEEEPGNVGGDSTLLSIPGGMPSVVLRQPSPRRGIIQIGETEDQPPERTQRADDTSFIEVEEMTRIIGQQGATTESAVPSAPSGPPGP